MISSDLARIFDFPKVYLGDWPTPISNLPHSESPGILVKRDDLSGHGRGGVKIRKIEQLIGYMLANEYSEFITVVGNVTNLIHDTLIERLPLSVEPLFYLFDTPVKPL